MVSQFSTGCQQAQEILIAHSTQNIEIQYQNYIYIQIQRIEPTQIQQMYYIHKFQIAFMFKISMFKNLNITPKIVFYFFFFFFFQQILYLINTILHQTPQFFENQIDPVYHEFTQFISPLYYSNKPKQYLLLTKCNNMCIICVKKNNKKIQQAKKQKETNIKNNIKISRSLHFIYLQYILVLILTS
eukprot:TRINITY_DN6071_c0_g1_i6.p2 TRINITY_DN6071_c0_g1~~TRINITY_DN6071_c0_g1_i6.p2  ORF type:complete len:186 (+),score=-15.22 TRINITY_DN6071_c0_g1_i6:222-779(+)